MLKRLFSSFVIVGTASWPVIADDWSFSPSIHVSAGQSEVEGTDATLNRDNTVIMGHFNGELSYESEKLESRLVNETKVQRYSEDKEFDWVNSNWLWQTDYGLLDDRLQLSHLFIRKVQLFDTIRGAFADDWYAKDNGATRYQRTYRVNYQLPMTAPIDASFLYTHNEAELKAPDDVTIVGPDRLAGSDYEQRRLAIEFGHYLGLQKLRWRVKARRDLSIRQQDNRFLIHEVRGRASYPIYDNWHAVGTGFYSQHENPDGFEYGLENDKIKYRTVGLGLSWQSQKKNKRLQFTHEWDQSNELTFWGGEVDWRFSERWRVSGFISRRFYGDASGLDLFYDMERNRFNISYEEAVQIDFFLLPDSELLGVYVCNEQESLDNVYDPERCVIPESMNTLLGPGQYLSVQRQGIFPVEERLVLQRGWTASWDYLGPKWAHTLYVVDRDQEDIELDWGQENEELLFEGDYRFASNYFVKAKVHYRSTDLIPSGQGSRNRLYSMGYHHELNSKADWSISLMHINQDSTANVFSYEENRVVLGYTHHFGRNNTHRRDLFHFNERPGAVSYGINTGW